MILGNFPVIAKARFWIKIIRDNMTIHFDDLLWFECFSGVKLTRGYFSNSQGFATLKYLCYVIAILASIVSAFAFARLVLLKLYIGLSIFS